MRITILYKPDEMIRATYFNQEAAPRKEIHLATDRAVASFLNKPEGDKVEYEIPNLNITIRVQDDKFSKQRVTTFNVQNCIFYVLDEDRVTSPKLFQRVIQMFPDLDISHDHVKEFKVDFYALIRYPYNTIVWTIFRVFV